MFIAPSVLAADYSNIDNEIKKIPNADYVHLDIMDGHFVPNISFGPKMVNTVRKLTNIPLDVHLMLSHPLQYIDVFANAGADYIVFHFESEDDPSEVIAAIKKAGKKPGIALKPSTRVEQIAKYLLDIDMVVIMTVEPGFGGQKFMENQVKKIEEVKKYNPQILVEIDGGINEDTIIKCAEAGADICVAGTAVFGSVNPYDSIIKLKKTAVKK
jgi:ribulose-phosphate 3-epimerase